MIYQQLINGLMLGASYALVAIGYTLIFGVLNLLYFAHGEVFMIGAFAGLFLVLYAGANIYGAQATPKYIPPFAWGDAEPYARFESNKFIEVAERMMARRHVTLGPRGRLHLAVACETAGEVSK